MKKVLLVTEYLNPPYDEGIKKTVYNLFLNLDDTYDLQVICRHGFKKENISIVNANALFFSRKIKNEIKKFDPEILLYFPFQSSTFASYLRLKILLFFSKTNKVGLIALQPKSLAKWQETIVKFLKPDFAFTPSPTLHNFWNRIGCNNSLIPLLTNLTVFKPLNSIEEKFRLREKYELPKNAFIISHMGHLNKGRNLKTLIPLQKLGYQMVIVGSSSTPSDALGQESLKKQLLQEGIIIVDRYIEHIEEIYQLSDAYIFPVIEENSSIGMPLSVLEARGCGIPVIMTDYGSIKFFLEDDYAGIYYSKTDNFIDCAKKIKDNLNKKYTKTNVSQLNKLFYDIIHKKIDN